MSSPDPENGPVQTPGHCSAARARWLAAVVESSGDAIISLDLAGRITTWNRGAEQVFGRSAAEAIGRSVRDLCPEDGQADQAALLERLRVGGTVDSEPVVRVRVDGASLRLLLSLYPVVDETTGEITGTAAIARDVTDLAQAHDLLAQSERRFRALVAHGSDLIALLDAQGVLLYASPSLERTLGFTAGTGVGESVARYVHPDDQDRVRSAFGRLVAEPDRRAEIAYRIVRADGGWRHLEVTATNLLHLPEVGGVVFNARDVTETVTSRALLAHQSMHDALTGLPNRVLFCDRLEQALRRRRLSGTDVAVIAIDLDEFRLVNETLGHAAGDEVLVAVAQRIAGRLRAGDTVARLGGDEFAVCCEGIRGELVAVDMTSRLAGALAEPVAVADRLLPVTASIGVAVAPAGSRADPGDLLGDADVAMYRAKELGRARIEVFDPSMREAAHRRMDVTAGLRRALSEGELVVHYQPIVGLDDGAARGVEALVRWNSPTRGLLPPSAFISVAEQSNLIVAIGQWVLDDACRQVARWHRAGMPLDLSVNLSARQVGSPGLVEHVRRALHESGLPAASLCLEITETDLMADVDTTDAVLGELRSLGVRIAADDFGTGYSSLAYLRRFPLDHLKIDRSFVAGVGDCPEDDAIVRAVIRLAEALGLGTVAEGVETDEQAARLRDQGCHVAQGFRFSPPVPAGELPGVVSALTSPLPGRAGGIRTQLSA